jgi:hypothetical protein
MGNQRATQTKATEATSQRKSATVTKPPLTRRTAVHPMLQLQRTVGNRAVNQLIERQRMTQETGVSKASVPIQAKLTIGEPGDKYEQEADRVATQVVNQIQAPASQPSASEPSVQRMEMTEEEDEQLMTKPMVQRLSAGGEMAAPPDLEASIQQARGGGQPLSDNIREPMEQAFGADFSGVRVHTDATSDQLNQSIQAKAFTTGQDVFFRQGAYQTGSRKAQELIAHELTHVVQQSGEGGQLSSTHNGRIVQRDGELVTTDVPPIDYSKDQSYYRELFERESDKRSMKKLYMKLALRLHPDKNPAMDDDEPFKVMKAAYESITKEQTGLEGTEIESPHLPIEENGSGIQEMVDIRTFMELLMRQGGRLDTGSLGNLNLTELNLSSLNLGKLLGVQTPTTSVNNFLALPAPPQEASISELFTQLPPEIKAFLNQYQDHKQLASAVLKETNLDVNFADSLMPLLLQDPPPDMRTLQALIQTITELPHARQIVFNTFAHLNFSVEQAQQLLYELYKKLPLAANELPRAEHIFVASGYNIKPVKKWITKGKKGQQAHTAPLPRAGAAPPVHPLAGPDPVIAYRPLDQVLGAGAHAQIRQTILTQGRNYSLSPFITNHARTLINANANANANVHQANVLALLNDFCNNINRVSVFNRAVNVAQQMFTNNVTFNEIQTFIVNNPFHALSNQFQPAISNLVTRENVTAATLINVLNILRPLGNPGMLNLLINEFAQTPGLTLNRLYQRLTNFTNPLAANGQNIAIAQVRNEFQPINMSLNARVHQGTMSQAAVHWIKYAFRLLRQATRQQMLAFLNNARVSGHFAQPQNQNPAYWLYLFAKYHRGAPPGGFANRVVQIYAGGANQNVTINNWIVEHVQQRHTFEHFHLIPYIINRAPTSTIITPPTTADTIANGIQQILNSPEVSNAYPWANVINIGTVQLRIIPNPGGGGYLISQYYYAVAPGLGQVVRQAALHAIRQHFPFLVY